jgi:molybdopterin molybdotransferase
VVVVIGRQYRSPVALGIGRADDRSAIVSGLMQSIEQASARILELVTPLAAQRVALDDADGRYLAADVIATRSLPGFDNSAMDGFAIRAHDVPATLPVVAAIAAGATMPAPLPSASAVRIMTGAPLPPGADTVVIFEDAHDHGATVDLPAAALGDNVRRVGEDVANGDRVIAAGHRLGPGELTVLAALGCAQVPVGGRPRVALIATGDELRAIDATLAPGQLVDSSAYGLRAAIRAAGGEPDYLGIVGDDRQQVTAAITRALTADIVITTGGVSAGDHDYVRTALADAGVALDFWKVAMKPGKPLAVGRAGRTLVFALPGNPVSSAIGFELFVRPALLALQGAAVVYRPRVPVVVPDGYDKPAGRAHVLRAGLHRDGARLIATPHRKQGSAMQSSLVGCDALLEIPAAATAIAPGATVTAWLLAAT